jgi:MoxR-like ATPase
VLRQSTVESRFEALRSGSLTPLVGREEEIELLLRRWRQAQAGQGRVVLLSGEAGIGKSRITRAFQEHLAGAFEGIEAGGRVPGEVEDEPEQARKRWGA